MRSSRTLLFVLVLMAVAQGAYYCPRLPDVMASHFDGSGTPDGFQSKTAFFLLVGGVVALTVGLFAFAGPFVRWLPTAWINLPHRDYWLSGRRREETLEYLAARMEWFGVATTLLLLLVLQMVYEVNLTEAPSLDSTSMWWILGLYFAYTVVWIIQLVRRFQRPAGTGPVP